MEELLKKERELKKARLELLTVDENDERYSVLTKKIHYLKRDIERLNLRLNAFVVSTNIVAFFSSFNDGTYEFSVTDSKGLNDYITAIITKDEFKELKMGLINKISVEIRTKSIAIDFNDTMVKISWKSLDGSMNSVQSYRQN